MRWEFSPPGASPTRPAPFTRSRQNPGTFQRWDLLTFPHRWGSFFVHSRNDYPGNSVSREHLQSLDE